LLYHLISKSFFEAHLTPPENKHSWMNKDW